jgi:hypothetical protein
MSDSYYNPFNLPQNCWSIENSTSSLVMLWQLCMTFSQQYDRVHGENNYFT